MEDNGFKEKMLQKSNEELLEMVELQRQNFQPGALADAQNVLIERGIAFTIPDESEVADVKEKDERGGHVVIGPFFVGIGLILMVILGIRMLPAGDDVFIVSLTINIIVRAIVMMWIYTLATKYGMQKFVWVWVVLAVIIGGWALIVINIVIWIKQRMWNED